MLNTDKKHAYYTHFGAWVVLEVKTKNYGYL